MGIYMQKEDLKSLVTQMYDELMQNIETQENPTQAQVITFLQDATSTISSIPNSELDSTEHAKLAFTNTYKKIAADSLTSYQQTNDTFEELSEVHKKVLSDCDQGHIDLTCITDKFNEIQSQMADEVKRANNIITDLNTKVADLERNSNLDSLTKIFNRRALTTYLNNVCSKKEIPYELHLLLLDIDDFKVVNDTYGHVAGDKVLIYIANLLRKTLRDGDKVFRYGGEEFVIVLNRIDASKCLEITNRILNLIRTNRLIYQGDSLTVTMSIGATKYHQGDTPDDLIQRADKALYKSKNSGKDQMNSEVLLNGN